MSKEAETPQPSSRPFLEALQGVTGGTLRKIAGKAALITVGLACTGAMPGCTPAERPPAVDGPLQRSEDIVPLPIAEAIPHSEEVITEFPLPLIFSIPELNIPNDTLEQYEKKITEKAEILHNLT